MRNGALQGIGGGVAGAIVFVFGEAEPDRFEMTAGGIFGGSGVSEGEGFDEVAVLFGEEAGVGKTFLKGLFVELGPGYGSNIQSIHYLDNCPAVITGGGAGVAHGRHLVLPDKTPLCNLWLSLLQGSGVEVESHGDSTGTLDELWN